MRIQMKPIAVALCLAGFIAAPAFGVTEDDHAKMQRLEMQLASLNEEVTTLKRSHVSETQVSAFHKRVKEYRTKQAKKSKKASTSANGEVDTEGNHLLQRKEVVDLIKQEREFLPFDMDVPGQAFVSTGPYVGVPIQFSGSNLLVNTPSVNNDVQLLAIRKKIVEQLHAMGGEISEEPYHSHLLFSGVVEGQAGYMKPGGAQSQTDIDLTNVALDAFFLGPSNWTLGFVEFMYDGSSPAHSVYTSTDNYRVSNSRVFVNKAFITIGDFTRSPFYTTFGQMYVPFGTYSSFMVSDTLTKLLARTKARAILVGAQSQEKNGLYGATYIFRGDTHTGAASRVNNGGINLGVKFDQSGISGNLGVGAIANMSDSGGMQLGNGFSQTMTPSSQTERIVHRVPAYDIRGLMSFGEHIDLVGEWVGASTRYNPNDMSFNGHGARPWALDTEASYSFSFWHDWPSNVGIGFGRSYQALALGIPQDRYSIVFNTSIWRNTLQSLEFRRDLQYPNSNTATGAGNTAVTPESGKFDNAVTAQFDYYF